MKTAIALLKTTVVVSTVAIALVTHIEFKGLGPQAPTHTKSLWDKIGAVVRNVNAQAILNAIV